MAMDQDDFDTAANTSFRSSSDEEESLDSSSSSLDNMPSMTKRDVFDLTLWKLHTLNRPIRRDASLRRSVLIFNLLRCLQREIPHDFDDDIEMGPNMPNSNHLGSGHVDDAVCADDEDDDDDGMMEDELKDDSLIDNVLTDAETRAAVMALSMIDQGQRFDAIQTSNVIFQLSPPAKNTWESPTDCKTAEPELMDIDHRNDASTFLISAFDDDHSQQRSGDDGLITESYRLLENGSCLNDNALHFGRNKSYASVAAGSFETTGAYNLFA